MRILHVTASYKPAIIYGGPIYSISNLAESCAKSGHEVTVLTTKANGKVELNIPSNTPQMINGVRVIYFSRWTGDHTHFSPGLFWKLWRNCRQFDVVHIHSWWNTVAVLSLLICLLRAVKPVLSLRGTLSTHTFQNNHTSIKNVFHRWIGRKWLRRPWIHVTSVKEASEALASVPGSHIEVIPNLIDLVPCVTPLPEIQASPLRLLFLGRIHPVKNIELLMDVLEKLDSSSSISLTIVGSGEESYVRGLQWRYRALSNVQWRGDLRDVDKLRAIDEADLLVLLSFTENFGNVILEALCRGTAVVVSDKVGLQEYVRQQHLGWVVSHDSEDLKELLSRLVQDRTELNRIRLVAPSIIMHDFGPSVLIKQYENLYQKVHFNFTQ